MLNNECQRALVLAIVTYIMVALSVLAFALTFRSKIAIKKTALLIERFQQDQLALAACVQARRVIVTDDNNEDYLEAALSNWQRLVPTGGYSSLKTEYSNSNNIMVSISRCSIFGLIRSSFIMFNGYYNLYTLLTYFMCCRILCLTGNLHLCRIYCSYCKSRQGLVDLFIIVLMLLYAKAID